MHILLTDILTCPRCGPAFGLILRADRAEDRRVLEGLLGCSNCREKYSIHAGIVDFGATPEPISPVSDGAAAVRLAGMLGVTEGPAFLMLAGPATAHAAVIAQMIEDVEVLTIGAAAGTGDGPGINRIYAGGPQLPIASGKVVAVALTGTSAAALLEEGARTVSPLGRLVLDPVPSDAAEKLQRHGMRIAAEQDGAAVAVRG
jgi:uncharacterized protein YbaR (Trm112 family)